MAASIFAQSACTRGAKSGCSRGVLRQRLFIPLAPTQIGLQIEGCIHKNAFKAPLRAARWAAGSRPSDPPVCGRVGWLRRSVGLHSAAPGRDIFPTALDRGQGRGFWLWACHGVLLASYVACLVLRVSCPYSKKSVMTPAIVPSAMASCCELCSPISTNRPVHESR